MVEKSFHFLTQLSKSFFTLLKILLRSKLSLPIPKGKGKDCFILGNGPSLNPMLLSNLEELKEKTLICVNSFTKTHYFKELKPAYFIFISPQIWKEDYSDPYSKERNKIIDGLLKHTTWDLTVFCPFRANENPEFIKQLKEHPHLSIVFFNDTPLEGLDRASQWFLDKGWGSPRPHNVIIPALLMAIRLSFKNVYLLGADHSWLPMITVNEKNEALINRKHFYDEKTAIAEKMYNPQQRPRRLHEILEKFVYTFKAYFQLESYAKSKGTKIWNATPDSFIDAFERIDFNQLIKTYPKSESQ